MAKRYFNWKFAVILLLIFVALGVSAVSLRQWYRTSRSEKAYRNGLEAYEQGDWSRAASELGRYIAKHPRDMDSLYKYAEAQLKIRPNKFNNIQQAINAYRDILLIDAGETDASVELIKIYLAIDRAADAEEVARKAIDAQKALQVEPDPDMRLYLAQSKSQQHTLNDTKLIEAMTELQDIVKDHPDHVLSYRKIAELVLSFPDKFPNISAEDWLNQAVNNNPQSAIAYLNRARYFLVNLNLDQAKQDIAQAVELNPTEVDTLLELAHDYIVIGELDQAENYLNQVQQQDSQNVTLWRWWALWARGKNDLTRMAQIAKEGMEKLGYQRWSFMSDAIFFMIVTDNLDQAKGWIEEAREEDFLLARMDYFEGLIARRDNQIYKANEHFQNAVRSGYSRNVDREMRILGYSDLNLYEDLADSYFAVGDIQTALSQLRKLAQESPENADIQFLYGRFLYRANQWLEAAKQAQIAYNLEPNNNQTALFWIRTQMRFLKEDDTAQWRALDARLAELAAQNEDSIDILNLQYQSALKQKQLDRAEQFIQNPAFQASEFQAKLAQINLLSFNGETDKVIAQLESLIEQFPDEIIPVLNLAQVLAQQNRPDQAVDVLQSALNRFEPSDDHRNLVANLAELLQQLNRVPEAIEVLQSALKQYDNPVIRRAFTVYLSELYQSQGDSARSLQVLQDLNDEYDDQDIAVIRRIINHPETADDQKQTLVNEIKELEGADGWQWRYEQALLWYNSPDFANKYTQLVTLLKENRRANSMDQTSRMLLARVYEKRSNLYNESENEREKRETMRLATDTYREAYNLTPDNILVIGETLDALYRIGEVEQAARIINQASQARLSSPAGEVDFKGRLALNQLALGNVDSSINILKKVTSDYPQNRKVRLLLAVVYINNGDYNPAETLLNELRTEDPRDLWAADWMVNLYLKQTKNDQALSVCQQMIDALNSVSSYVLRARTCLGLNQPDSAAKDYNQALSMEPENTALLLEISDFYRVQEKYQQAVDTMEKVLALDGTNLAIRKRAYQLHLRLVQAGQPNLLARTSAMLDQDRNAYPDDLDLDLYKIQFLVGAPPRIAALTRSTIEQAKSIAHKVTKARPDIVEPWLILCQITLQENQPVVALDLVSRALETQPEEIRLLLLKAEIQNEIDPRAVAPIFENIHQRFPDDINYTVFLADAYMKTDQADLALKTLQDISPNLVNPENQRAISINLARARYKMGLKEEAVSELTQLFQAEPEDREAPLALALLLIQDQQWATLMEYIPQWYELSSQSQVLIPVIALELSNSDIAQAKEYADQIYQWLLNKEPENVNVLLGHALLLHSLNQMDQVGKLYQRILEIDPKNRIVLNNYAWFLCEVKGEYQAALNLADRGLQIKPDYIDLIDTRGVIYYRLEQWENAIQDFTFCIENYPRHVSSLTSSYFHLGRAQEKLNRKNEAIKSLKTALDLNKSIGGLSPEDEKEAQGLYQKLVQGV